MPIVSIIIPTYNRARLLGRAIDSVLAQTFTDFELIIVDDGSVDNTRQLVLDYADQRIRYVWHERNQGQNAALNSGVLAAGGKYVAFLDSDDEWLPEFLGKVLHVFEKDNNLGAVYTRAGSIQPDGTLKGSYAFHLQGYIYREALAQGYVSHMITIVVKRECFDRIGLFDLDFVVCQDNEFCLRLAKEYCLGLVPEALAIIHTDSSEVRLISNRVAYAEGWRKLIAKFETDILAECGKGVLATHYLRGCKHYLEAAKAEPARSWAFHSFQLKPSLRSLAFVVLTKLPGGLSPRVWTGIVRARSKAGGIKRIVRRVVTGG